MSCPFCEINKNRNKVLKEGTHYFITLSNPRLVECHLLVIPKRHVEKAVELNQEERVEIFNAVINLEEEILKKFALGCDIKTHYRPFVKQSDVKIDHLHFHLQPREYKDELYQKSQIHENKLWAELSDAEEEKFSKLFS